MDRFVRTFILASVVGLWLAFFFLAHLMQIQAETNHEQNKTIRFLLEQGAPLPAPNTTDPNYRLI